MLRILGRPNSFNVRKVLWACDELGVPFQREDWGRGYRPTTDPEFLALNPNGQVPVVLVDGHVMVESNAIIRYLAASHPGPLLPADPAGRQAIERWMDWVAYDVTHALRGAFLGGQLQEAPWNNPWFVAQGQKDLIELMELLSAHLAAHGPYMMGETFTLADIPCGLVVNRWFHLKALERPSLPTLDAYYALLSERPAFMAHGRNGFP